MSEPTRRADYDIPETDTARRGDLLSEYRRTRAAWLHDVIARVPVADQPVALHALLEHERCETEALIALADSWGVTVQRAYRAGIVHGGEDMSVALGLTDKPALAPVTKH